jgi:nitroreductase
MTFKEIVHYRRSVRKYKPVDIDAEKVRQCLELAVLAPTSSNMQLWEFYHVTNPELLKKLAHACLDQSTATTAAQMVVFVTRRDLFRKRASEVAKLQIDNVLRNSPPEKQAKRIKRFEGYYGFVMPFFVRPLFRASGVIQKDCCEHYRAFQAHHLLCF